MTAESPTKSEVLPAIIGFLTVAAGVYCYSSLIESQLVVGFGDSWIFTDMAKRLGIDKSLDMTHVFGIVYPPLYSLVISPAYAFFHTEAGIFSAIRIINIAVYSLIFYPLFRLLREYSGLAQGAAFVGALLLAFSPATLHYSKWVISEALYIPLVGLTFYWVFKEKHFGSLPDKILSGMLLSALMLSKAIGAVPVIAFFIVAAGQIAGVIRSDRKKSGRRENISSLFVVFAVFVLIMALKAAWYKHAIPVSAANYTDFLDAKTFPQLMQPGFLFDRVKNLFAYMLVAPQHISTLFVIWLLLTRRGKLLVSDPVLSLFFLCFLGTLIVVPIFTGTDRSGVYHSRYLMPFVFVSTLAAVKYADGFDKKSLIAVCAMLVLMALSGWPANLRPHATCYMDGIFLTASVFHMSALKLNVAYLALMSFAAYSLYAFKANRLKIAGAIVLCLTILGTLKQAPPNTGSSSFRAYDCGGIGAAIIDQLNSPARPEFYVDAGWRGPGSWIESSQIMLMVPAVPLYADAGEVKKKKNIVFLTFRKSVEGAALIKAADNLSLFRIY